MRVGTVTAKDLSVRMTDAAPELLEAIAICARVLGRHRLPAVITSLNDARHRKGSLHYIGRAADLRSKHVPRQILEAVYQELRQATGRGVRVLLESRDSVNEHFHIEITETA